MEHSKNLLFINFLSFLIIKTLFLKYFHSAPKCLCVLLHFSTEKNVKIMMANRKWKRRGQGEVVIGPRLGCVTPMRGPSLCRTLWKPWTSLRKVWRLCCATWSCIVCSTLSVCKMVCYNGPQQLCKLTKICPPVAVVLAWKRMAGERVEACDSLDFDVVEVADTMGWQLGLVKRGLRQLQWATNRSLGGVLQPVLLLPFLR